ncbi:UvrD-helicase domain-containing protein [Brucella sp. TWI432]
MKLLSGIRPTPEQMTVVSRIRAGVSLIRGAAGSGKTSTALTALRAATGTVVNQLRNEGRLPARILVLTYYNSLKGYVSALIEDQLRHYANDASVYVFTFDKWACETLNIRFVEVEQCEARLRGLARNFPRELNFVLDEVNYVLGRFPVESIGLYLQRARTGRGTSPQMDAASKQQLLDEVIFPYLEWKAANNLRDFHDLANLMCSLDPHSLFDIVVIDEAQDFSANQLRAVIKHAAEDAIITIVTDSAQRIYPRGTTWAEVGINLNPQRSHKLTVNYRNTKAIARVARSISNGLPIDDDSSIPDPEACEIEGDKPTLLKGIYRDQIAWTLHYLRSLDLENETVGFLHLKGGGCFSFLRRALNSEGFGYCELQGARDWPIDAPNIGLSTFHSAKGLEFDHLILLGLAEEHAIYGEEDDDDRFNSLKRLLAMGVGRARKSLIIGIKPEEELVVINSIDPELFEVVDL